MSFPFVFLNWVIALDVKGQKSRLKTLVIRVFFKWAFSAKMYEKKIKSPFGYQTFHSKKGLSKLNEGT